MYGYETLSVMLRGKIHAEDGCKTDVEEKI
jgi:hypothetical protein